MQGGSGRRRQQLTGGADSSRTRPPPSPPDTRPARCAVRQARGWRWSRHRSSVPQVERLDAALERAAGSTVVPLVGRSEELGRVLAALEPGRLASRAGQRPARSRPLFAGLHLPPPQSLGDAELDRTRLFEAVSRLVERVAAERPVALLVDDLHWADAASLELLHYLARGLKTRRVLLLGVYRLDEAQRRRLGPRKQVADRGAAGRAGVGYRNAGVKLWPGSTREPGHRGGPVAGMLATAVTTPSGAPTAILLGGRSARLRCRRSSL
jgi:hypothetical protein